MKNIKLLPVRPMEPIKPKKPEYTQEETLVYDVKDQSLVDLLDFVKNSNSKIETCFFRKEWGYESDSSSVSLVGVVLVDEKRRLNLDKGYEKEYSKYLIKLDTYKEKLKIYEKQVEENEIKKYKELKKKYENG